MLLPLAQQENSEDEARYCLGRSFGGDAKRQVKKPYKPGGRYKYKTRGDRRHGRANGDGRQLRSSWMQGVKVCFVYGRDHRANTEHSPEEVTAAIQRLKAKHPSALLTVEDLHSIVNMAIDEEEQDSRNEDSDEVLWNEDSDDDENSELVYMAVEDLESVERSLANNVFLHGLNQAGATPSAYVKSKRYGHLTTNPSFRVVTIDTAANRRSVMSRAQYSAYQHAFGRHVPMRPPKNNVKGIGGRSSSIGEATLQIPFDKLGIIIDVEFSILAKDTPSLLSNRDMIVNGLDISWQGGYLYLGERRQPFTFENYFYIHRWSARDVPFVLYTDDELRRIHRTFGHPSVSSTYKPLKRANKAPLKGSIRRKIE